MGGRRTNGGVLGCVASRLDEAASGWMRCGAGLGMLGAAALFALAVGGSAVIAQDSSGDGGDDGESEAGESSPAGDPALQNPGVEAATRDLERQRGGDVRIGPVGVGPDGGAVGVGGVGGLLPRAGADDLAPRSSGLVREGAFLVERQGILRPLKNGGWAVVFDRAPASAGVSTTPPMVLQPSTKLTEMRRLVAASDDIVTFRVSGQVFAYRGRNYLLPTFFRVVGGFGDDEATPGPGAAADEHEATGGGARGADAGEGGGAGEFDRGEMEPEWAELLGRDLTGGEAAAAGESAADDGGARDDAEALLAELEQRAAAADEDGRPRTAGGGGGGGGDDTLDDNDATGTDDLLREGLMLSARTGRLVRADGGWAFVYDTDLDPAAGDGGGAGVGSDPAESDAERATAWRRLGDRPIRLMPCLMLAGMERAMSRYEGSVRFSLSGRVYIYEGENWLLPTMYLVELDRTGNLVPGQ